MGTLRQAEPLGRVPTETSTASNATWQFSYLPTCTSTQASQPAQPTASRSPSRELRGVRTSQALASPAVPPQRSLEALEAKGTGVAWKHSSSSSLWAGQRRYWLCSRCFLRLRKEDAKGAAGTYYPPPCQAFSVHATETSAPAAQLCRRFL